MNTTLWAALAAAAVAYLLLRGGGTRTPVYGTYGGAYDPFTGNVLETRYPVQVPGGGRLVIE